MKKLVAISFLFIFLSANTELGQLFRLPVLIHHYLEHLELNEDESLASFLKAHYEKDINHPDDIHGDHKRLPFKALDCHIIQVPVILSQTDFDFLLVTEKNEIQDKKIYIIDEHYSFSHLKNIWQPPRLG